jgi:adenine-specific DNA-methyltransferase
MEKLDPKTDGASPNIVEQNIKRLRELFPEAFTEGSDEHGPRWKVDFTIMREILGSYVEDQAERYSFNWNGKARARRIAQTPSTGTLRPCPEESVNWDTTQNLFIEGDNLEVLKLLQKSYHKKVKMIYIDPPYNTGNEFIYPDKFQDNLDTYLRYTGQKDDEGFKLSPNTEASGRYHTNWLNMMYPRLKMARNLLCEDGLIFISIDDNEIENLKKVCDEIFGEENSLEPLVWKKRYQGAKEKHLVAVHEYILICAKYEENIVDIYVPITKEYVDRYYTNKDENYHKRGGHRTQPLEAGKSMDIRKNLRYSFQAPNGQVISPKRQWVWSLERVEDAMRYGEIGFSKDIQGQLTPYIKQYLKDRNGEIRKTKKQTIIDNVYTQNGTREMEDIFGNSSVFPFPKPTGLIKQLIEICCVKNNQIILDFFLDHVLQRMQLCRVMQITARVNGGFPFSFLSLVRRTPKPLGQATRPSLTLAKSAFAASSRN